MINFSLNLYGLSFRDPIELEVRAGLAPRPLEEGGTAVQGHDITEMSLRRVEGPVGVEVFCVRAPVAGRADRSGIADAVDPPTLR